MLPSPHNLHVSALGLAALLSGCSLLNDHPPSAKATQVAVHYDSCALTEHGTVRCWGSNEQGQLGYESERTNTPGDVKGLAGVTQITAGDHFHCALAGGEVMCWGFNSFGQLGQGNEVIDNTSLASSTTPRPVVGLSGITQIAVGDEVACALTSAGGVKCWGDGSEGQLGDGYDITKFGAHFSTKPVDVMGLPSGVKSIAAHGTAVCAVTSAGAVMCWGKESGSTPALVPGLESGIAKVFVGGARGFGARMLCAVTTGGEAKCMSSDGIEPILGRGTDMDTDSNVPTTVVGLTSGVTDMSIGGTTACAVVNGAVKCWGENSLDEVLGAGDALTLSLVPAAIPELATGAVSVSIGVCNTCAVANGAAMCWGRFGCVGNGNSDFATGETYNSPQQVISLP